jgi:phosphate transport system protein
MDGHTVFSYDDDLDKLKVNIIDMAMLVKAMIIMTDQSMTASDNKIVNVANSTDEKINELDIDIESRATNIIALRQPMAIDLRQSIAALKIAVIMERMGDLAKNTSNRINNLSNNMSDDVVNKIHTMVDINAERLEKVIVAYKTFDIELAKEVYFADQKVDEIYNFLLLRLEQDIMNMPQNTGIFLKVMFAIKNLERIGDYISKFASLVSYIITGNKI